MSGDDNRKQRKGEKPVMAHSGHSMNTGGSAAAITAVSLVTYVSQPAVVSRSPSVAKGDNHTMKNMNLPLFQGDRKQFVPRHSPPDDVEDTVDITPAAAPAVDPGTGFFPHHRGASLHEPYNAPFDGSTHHDGNTPQAHYFSHTAGQDGEEPAGKSLDVTI